ncbi:MAG: hypothetical protein AMXMBFR12_07370 [Candidatus Babeliales bacterium]
MKKIFLIGAFIVPSIALSMDKPDVLLASEEPKVPALRALCINKIADLAQTDPRINEASLAHLPLELAQPLWKKLEETQESKLIAQLPTRGKINADGSKVLLDFEDKPLKVYDCATGRIITLKESITCDNDPCSFQNKRFKYKWSSTGRYIYAEFFTPQEDIRESIYLYKIWDGCTGKKLYSLSSRVLNKLYFSPNDEYLLHKQSEQPLHVYPTATGNPMTPLGEATSSHHREPQDPQNQWLSACNNDSTSFYDTQYLTLVKKVIGCLYCFSQDGNLLAFKENEDTRQTYETDALEYFAFGIPAGEHRITKPYACIYNRLFQMISKIPLTGFFYGMAISHCNHFLMCHDSTDETHYSIATKQKVQELKHYFNKDFDSLATFSNIEGNGTIKLEGKKDHTHIVISQGTKTNHIDCPVDIKDICYTPDSQLVGLRTHKTIRYFLNLATGKLIPCNIELNRVLFNYNIIKYLSPDGRFVTQKSKDEFELRQLCYSEKLEPIMALLKTKVKMKKI